MIPISALIFLSVVSLFLIWERSYIMRLATELMEKF